MQIFIYKTCKINFLQYIINALKEFSEDTVFMRFICDTPGNLLAYPKHFPEKNKFLDMLRKTVSEI